MKIIQTRPPVTRQCRNCGSILELELDDLIRKEDKVVDGHTYFLYICPVCEKEQTAYWGFGNGDFTPGEWHDKLFPGS